MSYNLLIASLSDKQTALSYINLCTNKNDFLLGLYNIAIAQGGIEKLSKKLDIDKDIIHQSLSPHNNPPLKIIISIINALDLKLELDYRKFFE